MERVYELLEDRTVRYLKWRKKRIWRKKQKQKASEEKQEAEMMAQECEKARQNLQVLRQGTRRLYRTQDGSYSRFDEEERNARIQEAEAFIQEHCQ